MNNKGFIATSLIYSFFLIFITLFLTIIADYLQNKILLNTIEAGIKDTINSTKSVEDFEVGDIIYISIDGISKESITLPKESRYIIANIIFDYNLDDGNQSALILYNVSPTLTSCDSKCVTEKTIKDDLTNSGNINSTYIDKLLYISSEKYNFLNDDPTPATKTIKDACAIVSNNDINDSSCGYDSSIKYRERIEFKIGDSKFQIEPKSVGDITIKGMIL